MKKIIAIFQKETILRFTSPVEWLFFLILPLFFTFVLAGGTAGNMDTRTRLAVVDQANSPLSAQLIAGLEAAGTLRRLLTTPTRKATYLLGTLLAAVFWALVQMLLLVLFGIFGMKLNWGHSPAALAVILTASALAASAIGVAMGAFVKTEGQANGLSIMLGMVMALLGGCWYPLELFPAVVQQAVKVLPTRWAMQGMLDIVLRGQDLSAVLPEAAVLLGFAVVFYAIGIWRFRYE